jgi:hypothetical protein
MESSQEWLDGVSGGWQSAGPGLVEHEGESLIDRFWVDCRLLGSFAFSEVF